MTKIPQDIITNNILCRLPAKSVGRFRCVSKEWLSLLTDPRFIQKHQKTLNRNHFFFRPKGGSFNDSLHSAPYNNINDHEAVSTLTKFRFGLYQIQFIQCSFNGLVLAFAYKNNGAGTRLVLNPTTKDYVELPESRLEETYDIKGFGYDSVSDDYKVVMIKFDNNIENNVDVYSLKTNTWKQLSDSPYDFDYISYNTWKQLSDSPYDFDYISYNGPSVGLFANGFLHWICNIHSKLVIVAFSLADEKLSELQLPDLYDESDEDTWFIALGEKLALFNEVKGDIWLMNEYGLQKSWTRIVIHGFNEIPSDRRFFYDNGKLLFLTSDLLWIYDVEERTFCKSVDVSHMNIWRFEGGYAESLLSPKFSRST